MVHFLSVLTTKPLKLIIALKVTVFQPLECPSNPQE